MIGSQITVEKRNLLLVELLDILIHERGDWAWKVDEPEGDCLFVVSLNVISSVGMELACKRNDRFTTEQWTLKQLQQNLQQVK